MPRRRRRLCRYDLRAYSGYRRAIEGANPGSHLVQNDPQGKNVRPVVLGSALDLLRREVSWSPDEFSGPRKLRRVARDSKIAQFDLTFVGHENICRLHIAMYDARAMCAMQSVGKIARPDTDSPPRQRALGRP